jgi:hypothetical protein
VEIWGLDFSPIGKLKAESINPKAVSKKLVKNII